MVVEKMKTVAPWALLGLALIGGAAWLKATQDAAGRELDSTARKHGWAPQLSRSLTEDDGDLVWAPVASDQPATNADRFSELPAEVKSTTFTAVELAERSRELSDFSPSVTRG